MRIRGERLKDWGNVPVMAPTGAIQLGSLMVWLPIMALILRDLGASDVVISLAVATWTASEAVAQFVGGKFADEWGRRPILVVSSFSAAMFLLLGAFTGHWVTFTLLFVLMRFAKGFQTPARTMIIGESVRPDLQGRAFGVVEMFIASLAVLGPVLGAYLIGWIPAQRLLLVTAGGWGVAAFFRYRYLQETLKPNAERIRFSFRQLFRGSLFEVLLTLVAVNTIFNLTLWGPFMALHASDVFLLSREQINLFYAIGSGFGAASSPLVGRLVDHFGAARFLGVNLLLFGLAAFTWSFQGTVFGIILGYIAMGITYQVAMIGSAAYRIAMTDPQTRGAGLGACGMISIMIAALVVPIVGYLRVLWGSHLPFVVVAVLGLAVALRLLLKPQIPDWLAVVEDQQPPDADLSFPDQ